MKEYTKSFYLAAGECNPQAEMPVTLLVNRIIEVATLHANSWGVGYKRLIADNHAWVLSRVTTEIFRYPRVDETYSLTTWIEDYNRHFSQRNFLLADADGKPLGYARTIWIAIDLSQRAMVDISSLSYIRDNVSDRPCPIEPQSRLRQPTNGETAQHRFTYTDIDFNQHVNTIRYIELLLNRFTLGHHNRHRIQRLELAFVKESRYGEPAEITVQHTGNNTYLAGVSATGQERVRAKIIFTDRT